MLAINTLTPASPVHYLSALYTTARRRYSTQIREASSQVTPSPAC